MSSAVDNLADNLANASIQDQNSTTPQDTVLASAAEGRRLYIGNLAYATTEGELKEFFTDYKVESTSIPVNPRTGRPVGYAFVDLETADDAEKAITNLSGKEILDRKVSVQVARKPEAAGETTNAAEPTSGGEGRKRGSGRNRGRGRGRGGRSGRGGRGTSGEDGENHEVLPLTDVTNEANQDAPADAPTDASAATTAGLKEHKPRTPRPPKQRGPPEDGIPSTTKVMVANLPYDLSEEKLKDLFTAYEPTSAKIALRPIPRFMVKKLQARNEPRKGRGFGFVTLASEELQQKAVAEMNGKDIDGREIAVKVAIDSPGKEDGTEEPHQNGRAEEVATAA